MTRADLLAACAGGMKFTAEMARAICEGRKRRTMRVMKPQPRDYRDFDECLHGRPEAKFKPGDIVFVQEPPEMPPEVAPTFIRITGVKVQQARELTRAEIRAEGYREHGGYIRGHEISDWWERTFREIYPPEQWGENPWCWVYEFEKVEVEE